MWCENVKNLVWECEKFGVRMWKMWCENVKNVVWECVVAYSLCQWGHLPNAENPKLLPASSYTCKKTESMVEYYYYARKVKVRLSKKCFEKSLLVWSCCPQDHLYCIILQLLWSESWQKLLPHWSSKIIINTSVVVGSVVWIIWSGRLQGVWGRNSDLRSTKM